MGKVYLVGAGPGDPDLITIKGRKRLEECDVVIYDRLASEDLLHLVKANCIKIYVGKQGGHPSIKQEEINEIILEHGKKYDKVVRLKGGDSFVFGRGGEEIECLLQHNIPFEVIPGITSAIGVPEVAGIPVTHRGISQSFHVITGYRVNGKEIPSGQYEVLAKLEGTLVFLMGLNHIETIVDNLMKHGMKAETPVGVISNGTTKKERILRGSLDTIANLYHTTPLESPGIIVVGETAAFQYRWKDDKKQVGKSIGMIGTEKMMEKLGHQLELCQLRPVNILKLQVVKTKEYEDTFQQHLDELERYHWIVFTSQNGVHLFFEGLNDNKIDRRKLGAVKFAVIGRGTKEVLLQYGYLADYMPDKYTSKDLGLGLSQIISKGEKVFIPRAVQGSDEMTKLFSSFGIDFLDFPIYDVMGEGAISLSQDHLDELDIIAFASGSGVEAFFSQMEKQGLNLHPNQVIACIGEVTAEILHQYGKSATILSSVNDAKGLAQMISAYEGN